MRSGVKMRFPLRLNYQSNLSLFLGKPWNVNTQKTSSTFPSVCLTGLNHLAVVCWAHNLAACAISFFGHFSCAFLSIALAKPTGLLTCIYDDSIQSFHI
jgi:hypothetical protein